MKPFFRFISLEKNLGWSHQLSTLMDDWWARAWGLKFLWWTAGWIQNFQPQSGQKFCMKNNFFRSILNGLKREKNETALPFASFCRFQYCWMVLGPQLSSNTKFVKFHWKPANVCSQMTDSLTSWTSPASPSLPHL